MCVCMHVYVYSVCLRCVCVCSESNTWNIFCLTRKDNVLVSELIDGEPSMSKGVVESCWTIDCWSLTSNRAWK